MTIKRVLWPLTQLGYRLASIRTTFRPESNYYIFADPRGGSTWLTEILQSATGCPVLWEPATPVSGSTLEQIGFRWRQHIPEDDDWPEFREVFAEILSGKEISYHLYSHMRLVDYVRSQRLLVKICRGGGFLPWFVKTYRPDYVPVYLVRHPYAVIASQVQHGAWDDVSADLGLPETLEGSAFSETLEEIGPISTLEEKLAIDWCRGNAVNLRRARRGDDSWVTVHYEDLLMEPAPELARIWSAWGWTWDPSVMDGVRSPSLTATDEGFQGDVDRQLSKWRRVLRPDLLNRLDEILNAFGVTEYSSESDLPRKKG